MNYKNIPVYPKSKIRFEDLHIILKRKNLVKNQDETVNFLINFYEDNKL